MLTIPENILKKHKNNLTGKKNFLKTFEAIFKLFSQTFTKFELVVP
jgi:hypothetical protein